MTKPKIKRISKLEDLTLDASNANKGTERGAIQLDESLTRYGAGRSVLVDRRGVVIAGNKTVQEAVNKGFPARVVHTDGKELIVVQRTDLDLDNDKGGRARQLAYADNRVAEVDLEWDIERMTADLDAGVDLGAFWREDELKEMLDGLRESAEEQGQLGEKKLTTCPECGHEFAPTPALQTTKAG